jgi:hypothetical protein
MTGIRLSVAGHQFSARLEEATAPATCAAFRTLLPLRGKLLQARWSGQAVWLPLDGLELPVGPENVKHRPEPGEILFYPGGESDPEILIPYGVTAFAARCGPLSGNHFLTLELDPPTLLEFGRRVWFDGAVEAVFEQVTSGTS